MIQVRPHSPPSATKHPIAAVRPLLAPHEYRLHIQHRVWIDIHRQVAREEAEPLRVSPRDMVHPVPSVPDPQPALAVITNGLHHQPAGPFQHIKEPSADAVEAAAAGS